MTEDLHEYVPAVLWPTGLVRCAICGGGEVSAGHTAAAPTEQATQPVVMNASMLEDAKAGQFVQLVYRPETGATVHLATQPLREESAIVPGDAHDCPSDCAGECG